ncbi:LysR family transcriptional regulator [Marivita sp. XM-24bin2]|uniref:LysR family transcriptional regulator n=2 Tax=unclassified Marivita TaxID=2632480 RepID=UPI0025B9D275|nr:LysR family transcriptional regulator [Marivita sp. XM-24bin2]MCR9108050.1 LysR family transcriptional regulator [Paracoccaceae bacterium]
MHKLNWDDLRFVLAVADTGSVNAAARLLAVNHATVLRRIASFEEACGGPVFERDRSGYRLRPNRAPVIEAARLAAQHVQSAEALMQDRQSITGQSLRITSTDTFCQTVLSWIHPALARRVLPDRVTYLSSNGHLDMARLHADIALRPAMSLPDDLVGRQVAVMEFAVYQGASSKDAATWLGLTGALERSGPAKWMARTLQPDDVSAGADSFCVLAEMLLKTNAKTILPCILGDTRPELLRVECDVPKMDVPVWLACHRDLAGSDRLNHLMDALEKLMQPHLGALGGDRSG